MDVCRLCYSRIYPELSQNIFNEKFDPPIWKIIADLSNLEIRKDDPYTKIVCVHCFVELKNFYKFRQMMLNTDYRMRHNCSNNKNNSKDNRLDVPCSPIRNDGNKSIVEETPLNSVLQKKTDNHDNKSISDDNKSNNSQMNKNKSTERCTYNGKASSSTRIEIKNEISIEETEQSQENLSCPTIKIKMDDILKEGIEEQSPKISKNDKIENNSDNRASNIQKLTNDSNSNESETNTDKKSSQINGSVKNTEGVDYSSTGEIVLEQPLDKDCTNLNESIDENETNTLTGEELFQCEACHEKFPQENLLETHVKSVHSNQKFYKCELCKKNFLTVHQLPSHTVEHAKHDDNLEVCIYENPFNDDKSDRKFIYMKYLQTYLKEELLQCGICGKQFTKRTQLTRHSILHKDEKLHQCDICGKRYLEMRTLHAHLRSHTGEKPYNCKKCGKKFVYKESLRQHLRIHNGIKPYQCDTCGKKFSTSSILHRHFTVHTGEKSHQCNVCGKKFAVAPQLKIHSLVHTGEQPYCCNTCGKKFSRKDNLKKHSKIHTGEKPYECNVCNRRFLYKHVFRDHLKVHTGEK